MRNLNKFLLVALILGGAYLVYSAVYWMGANGSTGSAAAGAAIATAIVFPHLVCTFVAVLMNAIGLVQGRRGFALAAGILYAVAMVLFPSYFFFVVIEAVLCFVAYATMR
jgi:hypothetical protein